MPFVFPLCSSSKGNCTYVGDRTSGVLIDAGLSLRQFTQQMAMADIPPSAVRAVFITHEHSDHIKGLTAILGLLKVPVYASRETLEHLISKNQLPPGGIACEIRRRTADFGSIAVSCFNTPHDSVHSLGYRIQFTDGQTACICTDLGHVTAEVYQNLQGSDLVLLESNYDTELLETGSYPRFLKDRILSDNGHLCNTDCANTLLALFREGTTKFILGHLSQENNRPELAFSTTLAALSSTGARLREDYILTVAKPKSLGECIEL